MKDWEDRFDQLRSQCKKEISLLQGLFENHTRLIDKLTKREDFDSCYSKTQLFARNLSEDNYADFRRSVWVFL